MRREIKERYSCKRKRDYVTALAIFLFVMMIAFQIYLIVLLPVQIKNAETLEINVARETFLTQMAVKTLPNIGCIAETEFRRRFGVDFSFNEIFRSCPSFGRMQ